MSDTPDSKWDDLDELDADSLESLRKEKKGILNSLDSETRELRSERKDQVQIVRSLRSAIGGIESSGSGRRKLLAALNKSRKSAQEQREIRDSINKCIPPPSKILEEWLVDTYSSLTTIDNDLTSVPMLKPELSGFSRFFEIQASIIRKREAEEAHLEYVSSVTEMRRISDELDENKQEVDNTFSELRSNTEIGDGKISRKEIKRFSNRITQIDKRLDELKVGLKQGKRELRRIEQYAKISTRGTERVKISDIRGIAAKGGPLSAEEMGALLESGGFSSINESDDDVPTSKKVSRKSRKKGRKLGVSRSGSRRGSIASRRE